MNRKKIGLVTSFILVSLVYWCPVGLAHTPTITNLNYDYNTKTLDVSISHLVGGDPSHYISLVEVRVNGSLVNSTSYTSQPSSPFTYQYYNVIANHGATIQVTIYCSISGSDTESLNVVLDIAGPIININTPTPGQIFSTLAPSSSEFDITFQDTSGVHSTWYILYNASVNTNNYSWTGSIAQSVWDQIYNGSLTFRIYANDTLGNLNFAEVAIIKDRDLEGPSITINAPTPGQTFSTLVPDASEFDIIIQDISGVNSTWYMLYNASVNTNNYSWTGSIAQSVWDQIYNGSLTFRIYANDTLGNLNFSEVAIIKERDVLGPNITINKPDPNQLFGETAPGISEFDIVIQDISGVHNVYYMLYNASVNTDNYTWSGSIAQSVWDQIYNGSLTFRIYANDTLGNLNYAEVLLLKDINYTIPEENGPDGEIPQVTIIGFDLFFIFAILGVMGLMFYLWKSKRIIKNVRAIEK